MKKVGICRVVPWLLWVAVAMALPVTATLVVRLDLPELIDEADLIVEARAETTESVWIAGELFTLVQLRVHEVWKGHHPQSEVRVLLPGGTDTQRPVPVAAVWAGQPKIATEHEYVLFLIGDAHGPYYHLVGFSQGLFAIRYDEQETVVVQDLRGLRQREPTGDIHGSVTTTSIGRLKAVVRSVVEESQAEEVP